MLQVLGIRVSTGSLKGLWIYPRHKRKDAQANQAVQMRLRNKLCCDIGISSLFRDDTEQLNQIME